MTLHHLQFPIGTFTFPTEITKDLRNKWIDDIATFPTRISDEVSHLSDEQLNTTYRPEGWTIRQVIHHCADSHTNSFIRLKLALTEENPIIKPYFEERWAELVDSKMINIQTSLLILVGVHERWTFLLKNATEEQFKRTFTHPEQNREISIEENTSLYAWHGNHHLAHITEAKKRNNWL